MNWWCDGTYIWVEVPCHRQWPDMGGWRMEKQGLENEGGSWWELRLGFTS